MRARFVLVLVCLALAVASLPVGGCGDNDNSVPCCPVCGDGVCSGDEEVCSCRADCHRDGLSCPATVGTCGDAVCDGGELHETCPDDCPLACRLCGDQRRVIVPGRPTVLGSTCPAGTTEAYRDGDLLVCHECGDASDCADGKSCRTQCGPGCAECCPVRVCSSV